MKKFLILASILFLGGFTLANTQLDQAISWMNTNGLTKFTNATDFMATKSLRRDEATKFFVQYATEILGRTPDTSKTSCNFSDLSKARPDLKDLIKESCQLGLFQGTNGKFMPTQSLTNAQAITVLIRMIDGQKDETQGHFAQKYFEKAQELGIMNGLLLNSTANFDKLTTRGEVGILLYNSSNLDNTGAVSPIIPNSSSNKEITLTDAGKKITSSIHLTQGLHKFKLSYNGESNFSVTLLDSEGNYIALLANEIGDTSSSIGVKIEKEGDYLFNVTAEGTWTITTDYSTPRVNVMQSTLNDVGGKIIGPFNLTQGLHKFKLSHNGESNFSVTLLYNNGDYISLLANEIGNANSSLGVRIDKSGDYYFNITADGTWTIEEYK
ncbi:MAG: hypothetical protein WCO66_03065 [Candidatus Absconditabacteria bacterium]